MPSRTGITNKLDFEGILNTIENLDLVTFQLNKTIHSQKDGDVFLHCALCVTAM